MIVVVEAQYYCNMTYLLNFQADTAVFADDHSYYWNSLLQERVQKPGKNIYLFYFLHFKFNCLKVSLF